MDGLSAEQLKLLQDTHDAVIQLKTVVLGANGHLGLSNEIKSIQDEIAEVSKSSQSLRINLSNIVKEVEDELKPNINKIEAVIYDDDNGLIAVAEKTKSNSNWIKTLWGVCVGIGLTLAGVFVSYIF